MTENTTPVFVPTLVLFLTSVDSTVIIYVNGFSTKSNFYMSRCYSKLCDYI